MRFLSFGDRPTHQTAISFVYFTSVYGTFTNEAPIISTCKCHPDEVEVGGGLILKS